MFTLDCFPAESAQIQMSNRLEYYADVYVYEVGDLKTDPAALIPYSVLRASYFGRTVSLGLCILAPGEYGSWTVLSLCGCLFGLQVLQACPRVIRVYICQAAAKAG